MGTFGTVQKVTLPSTFTREESTKGDTGVDLKFTWSITRQDLTGDDATSPKGEQAAEEGTLSLASLALNPRARNGPHASPGVSEQQGDAAPP